MTATAAAAARSVRRATLAACVALIAAACRDIPAPPGGVLSLSRVILPSPGVVAGDTLRDSAGVAVPVRVIAFGNDGEPLAAPPIPEFLVLGAGAHLVDSLLVGDTPGTRVGVIASVASLQTQPESVTVILRPDTLVPADSTRHLRTFALLGDTVVTSAELSTIVHHHADADTTEVPAVVVYYQLVSAPEGNGNGPTVVLMNGSTPSARDTTSATGRASRTVRLRIAAFAGVLDSAVVHATASHRGVSLGTVEFTIVFQRQ